MSGYSLWETSLRAPAVTAFVPPVIPYASPYQNSNFEAFAIPVTLVNDGAQTGTIVSMDLVVRDPRNNVTKRFYSAACGNRTLEKARAFDLNPFAPISLAGRASQSETVLFFARHDEKVMQVVEATGTFEFRLELNVAGDGGTGLLDRLWRRPASPLAFEMGLPHLDHRAFNVATVTLHHKDWRPTVGGN